MVRRRREEGCRFSQKLVILLQVKILPTQPLQLATLVLVQRTRRTPGPTTRLLPSHPRAQSLLPNIDLPRHRHNRTARINHQTSSLPPILLSKRPTLSLLLTHLEHPSSRTTNPATPSVHIPRVGPLDVSLRGLAESEVIHLGCSQDVSFSCVQLPQPKQSHL